MRLLLHDYSNMTGCAKGSEKAVKGSESSPMLGVHPHTSNPVSLLQLPRPLPFQFWALTHQKREGRSRIRDCRLPVGGDYVFPPAPSSFRAHSLQSALNACPRQDGNETWALRVCPVIPIHENKPALLNCEHSWCLCNVTGVWIGGTECSEIWEALETPTRGPAVMGTHLQCAWGALGLIFLLCVRLNTAPRAPDPGR